MKAPRFDAAWQRRRKWSRRLSRVWSALRWVLAFAAIAGGALLVRLYDERSAQWAPVERSFALCGERSGAAACVIDGDTLAIGQRRIRLTGYDAPEIAGQCEAERRLAQVAKEELAAWLNLGAFELDGGADPPRDQYGRELRAARRGGEELADTMVERELARRSRLDRGWCEGG